MARKKKGALPSGNFRVQVLDYTDADGKRHYQSFTADTKAKAQAMANEWKYSRRQQKEVMKLNAGIEAYISAKEAVLSPSTIRGYRSYQKAIREYPVGTISIRDITNADLQRFVSAVSIGHTSKYVKNLFGLISSVLTLYAPDFRPHVSMPAPGHTALYTPTDKDIQLLIDNCPTTQAKLAILFGAIGFMRRGEAAAVTFEDVDYKAGTIAITKSMVEDQDGNWITKDPKTYDSYRKVLMPQYVLDMIKGMDRKTGRILGMGPDGVYKAFKRALKKSGLPDFRYHDLRHHAASYAHSMGIADRYTEAMGGWKPNSPVLKRVYENVIDLELVKSQKKFVKNQQFSV